MLQHINLRDLAEIHGNGRDVVSAFFQGKAGLSKLSQREQLVRDLLEDDDLELENFECSMEKMREFLDEAEVDDHQYVCLYSSELLGLMRGYHLDLEVPSRLVVGPAPYIRPIAELQDEYETFLVVACDNDRTKLITVTNETSEVEQAIKGGVKNHVRKGGWSQQRYERRRDEQLGHYGKETADAIEELVSGNNIHRVVLAGSEETMQTIEESLSNTVRELIVGREAFDLHRPVDELIDLAYDDYFNRERADERDLWKRIKGEALSEGRGCTGPTDTLDAARIGRVDTAIVTRDIKLQATRCRECEDVASGERSSCRQCGSKSVFEVDFVDALARQLELTSAALDFVDEIKALAKVGHVGALLRY